jgi:hypothetical protein
VQLQAQLSHPSSLSTCIWSHFGCRDSLAGELLQEREDVAQL